LRRPAPRLPRHSLALPYVYGYVLAGELRVTYEAASQFFTGDLSSQQALGVWQFRAPTPWTGAGELLVNDQDRSGETRNHDLAN